MKIRAYIFLIALSFWASNSFAQKGIKELFEQKFQISVVMPFCGKDLMENPNHKNASIGNACRQYYEGFLLAMDSFKRAETPIEIRVFDTKRDSTTFQRILEKKEIQNSDLIVGPVLKEGNELMLGFCNKNKIYHISPFLTLTKSKIDNPYLISVYPDLNYYGDFILNHIQDMGEENANIVVLTGKDNNDKVLSARILALKSKYPLCTIKSIDISKYTDFKSAYKLGKPNRVIISSENEFLVGSALRYLNDSNSFIDIEVFGLRKWLEFKSLNIPQFERLNVKIISPFYFDYTDSSTKLFIERYRELYNTEPTEYAVTGYEQATYFMSSLILNHGNLGDIKSQKPNKPLSNWYKIESKPEGLSLQNNRLNILYFENGKLKRFEN